MKALPQLLMFVGLAFVFLGLCASLWFTLIRGTPEKTYKGRAKPVIISYGLMTIGGIIITFGMIFNAEGIPLDQLIFLSFLVVGCWSGVGLVMGWLGWLEYRDSAPYFASRGLSWRKGRKTSKDEQ